MYTQKGAAHRKFEICQSASGQITKLPLQINCELTACKQNLQTDEPAAAIIQIGMSTDSMVVDA